MAVPGVTLTVTISCTKTSFDALSGVKSNRGSDFNWPTRVHRIRSYAAYTIRAQPLRCCVRFRRLCLIAGGLTEPHGPSRASTRNEKKSHAIYVNVRCSARGFSIKKTYFRRRSVRRTVGRRFRFNCRIIGEKRVRKMLRKAKRFGLRAVRSGIGGGGTVADERTKTFGRVAEGTTPVGQTRRLAAEICAPKSIVRRISKQDVLSSAC